MIGKLSYPTSVRPSRMVTPLSSTTWSSVQPLPMDAPCMTMESFTVLPRPTVTPRNSTLFSTAPSMSHPSASIALRTAAAAP